jgi:hypothetical protein
MSVHTSPALEKPDPSITALLVSPVIGDLLLFRETFAERGWSLHEALDCEEALAVIRQLSIPVVICYDSLPNGNWKTLLGATARLPRPPRIVVSSVSARFELSEEVRGRGGYSVLVPPVDVEEIEVVVQLASRSWFRQWRHSRTPHANKVVAATRPSFSTSLLSQGRHNWFPDRSTIGGSNGSNSS